MRCVLGLLKDYTSLRFMVNTAGFNWLSFSFPSAQSRWDASRRSRFSCAIRSAKATASGVLILIAFDLITNAVINTKLELFP